MRSGGEVVTCMFRQFSRKFWRSGTDCGRGHVVHDVGKIRAVGAALVAAGMVLSGCGLVGGEGASTTTSSTAETPSNPWDLPIEQRPELARPCEGIPIEAVVEGVGSPVEPIEEYERWESGSRISCGWGNREILLNVLTTWKSREDYLADQSFRVLKEFDGSSERPGLQITEATEGSSRTCIRLFFTPKGTVWISLDLATSLQEFDGEYFAEACPVLTEILPSIASHIPEGDIQ